MLLGIDHLVIAVRNIDRAASTLEDELGLEVGPGGRHPAWGTANRLAWLGDVFIELIGIFDEGLARETWVGAATLATLERGGGLVVAPLATNDIEADVAALQALGSSMGPPAAGERLRPDGRVVRWRLARPPSPSPTEPFLIEHDTTAAEWTPAERAERASQRHPVGGPVRLETLELEVDDVRRTIPRLARSVGLRFRPSLAGGGSRDATIGPHVLRLRRAGPDAAGSATTIRLVGPGLPDRSVDALGCRWVLRPG
jgi:hypothetical protein